MSEGENIADRVLIAGCLKGDGQMQTLLVRRYSNLVYASILGSVKAKAVTLSENDVEDLHNTVFVLLFEKKCKKLAQYKGRNGCSLASWIRMIAVRAVLDHLRRRRDPLSRGDCLVPLDGISDLKSPSPSAWDCMADKEQRHYIEAGIKELAPRDQLMIRMHCLEGCPLKQMAAILKVSTANIHSVKHRAVRRLKKAVALKIEEGLNN